MNEWLDELSDLTVAAEPVVVVTVAGIRGSAPREIGAKMLVTKTDTLGTIGGGQLEYQCSRIAFGMLDAAGTPLLRSFPLGASMGQCCGGVVEVLFEPLASGVPSWLRELQALHYRREAAVVVTRLGQNSGKWVVTADEVFGPFANDLPNNIVDQARRLLHSRGSAVCADDCFFEPVVASDFNIAVFGAGHVGTAVVRVLSSLDCNLRWIDSRRGVFRQMPANVRVIETAEPALEVAALPPGSCFLVMTHSHALDFEICDRILRRRDAAYCGLIGSHTKRRRFEKRYRALGMPAADLEQLACPIGVDGIRGKKPAEIAVSTAAEVLRAHERAVARSATAYPDNVHPLKS